MLVTKPGFFFKFVFLQIKFHMSFFTTVTTLTEEFIIGCNLYRDKT